MLLYSLYLCQVQDGGCDCREALIHWDSARTFGQSDSRKDGIPVEQLLVMSCQVTYYRNKAEYKCAEGVRRGDFADFYL